MRRARPSHRRSPGESTVGCRKSLRERQPAAIALLREPSVAALRAPDGDGPAAPWIHLWALTAAAGIVVPRALLALYEGRRSRRLAEALASPLDEPYYLRLRAFDRPGVLADITRILADSNISIDAMVQKEPAEGEEQVNIILLTHITVEKNINAAIAKIEALDTVAGKVMRIRLEELTSK